jgi:SAM-dependent methyltransferase
MSIKTIESKQWSEDPFLEKFVRIPSIYYLDRMRKVGFIPEGKRILDFGCGSGLVTYGMAAHLNPEYIVGVDLELYIDEHENVETSQRFGFDFAELKGKVDFRAVQANESLGHECFDCVVSWSVIEHVDRRIFNEQMRTIHDCLAPNGIAIIQSAPLYYSPFGSHVYELPAWSHLFMSESEFDSSIYKIAPADRARALLSCKNTLNRFDSREFTDAFLAVGFKVLDCYSTNTTLVPPESLLRKFNPSDLLEEQCVWVLSKNVNS